MTAMDTVSDNNPINLLDVSEGWKRRFRIIEKAGEKTANGYKNQSQLTFREKHSINYNIWAFLFGPFYYFAKGMYQKGLVLLGITFVISFVIVLLESALDQTFPRAVYYAPAGALCATLASYDYYMLKVKHVTIWEKFKPFQRLWMAGVFAAGCFILPLTALVIGNVQTPDDLLSDMSGVWRDDNDGTVVEISLAGHIKRIKIAQQTVAVDVKKTEVANGIVVLKPTNVNQIWTLRQIWDGDSFTLKLIVDDKIESDLSYIRPL